MQPLLRRCCLVLIVPLAPLLLASGPPAPLPPNPHPDTGPTQVSGVDACFTAPPRREHLKLLNVLPWHRAGQRGKGVKVAILDSGFQGYQDQLGKVLPAKVAARSFRDDGNLEAKDSQHGILCGEIVHALAPDAEILFANWEPSQPARFLEAVKWAIDQGASVINCSIIMPTWSDGEGGGPVHAQLAEMLGDGTKPGSVLFFACAGNTADRHWSGPFRDAGRGWHTWGEGVENRLTPWGDGRVSVELCADRDADLDLVVLDAGSGRELQRSRLHREHRTAVVRFLPVPGRSYNVRVQGTDVPAGLHFHLFVLGGSLRQARAKGSIAFPGDGPEVVTVGAVEEDLRRAPYSSCGPNSSRPKPDVVAMVPFGSVFRPRPFAGTSAATPQAAGLAALLRGRHHDWSAARVRQALEQSARDLGPPGHDWETGHGLIRLPTP